MPRQTVLLRDAIEAIANDSRVSPPVSETLKSISSNLALCSQIRACERASRISELTDDWIRALEAPFVEIRDKGVFETKLIERLPHTLERVANYENQFKSPTELERQRLEEEFERNASIAFDPLHSMLAYLDCAWLNEIDELASMQRLINLQCLGAATRAVNVFTPQNSDRIRRLLGDWRDEIAWPNAIWSNPVVRTYFYEGLGFDRTLTDVQALAFKEILKITEIKSDPPDLIEAYGPMFQSFGTLTKKRRSTARTWHIIGFNDWRANYVLSLIGL